MLLIGCLLACLHCCVFARLGSDDSDYYRDLKDWDNYYYSDNYGMSRPNDWREGRGFRNSGISRHRRGGRGSSSRGGSGGERGGWKAERPRSSFNEEKRPPGLRGKAIGLWYRDRNKQKKKDGDGEYKARPFPLELDEQCETEIRRSLDNVKARPPEHLVRKYALMNRSEDTDTKMEPGCCNATTEKYRYLEESKFKTCFLNSITGSIEENLRRSIANSIALVGDSELDERYLKELDSKNSSAHYQEMMQFRMKLPSYAKRDEIVQLIESNQVIVVSGETGCGKTTQVAQFILDNEIRKMLGSKCRILCTQPRRISAISVAERVADERDEPIGNYGSVGYQIRLEKSLPRNTGSILFCTTGILLQYMQTDPALSTVSHIIIDEIHERDTISDFAITILKDVLAKRKDLKLILMSATLNAERFSKYYNNCPMITIPGFTFPVTEYYLEDILEMTRYNLKPKKGGGRTKGKDKCYAEFIEPHIRNLKHTNKYSRSTLDTLMNPEIEEVDVDLIFELIKHISFQSRSKDTGAILVFLTGWDRISNLHKRLTECGSFPADKFLIIPLHSMMPTATQKTIFNRPPPGVRKIVIATNIAETSITIDDIVYVIDCGKIKLKNFDVENNISTLKPEWVSLANARQRRGRAGRVQEGVCYHLFSKAREMSLETYPLPEMLRTRLEEVILQAKILQLGHVKPFLQKVLDPPNPAAVDLSLNILTSLNALDDDETLTPLGYHLAQLPLDPQTGKMILMGALFNCIDPIFSIAASLSFKDAFTIPLGKEDEVDGRKQELDMGRKSDHLVLAEAFSQWEQAEHEGWGYSYCQRNFLSRNTLCLLKDMKKQFAEYLYDMKFLDSRNHKANESNINSNNVALIRAIICAGLYPNIAVIKNVRMIKRIGRALVLLRTAEDGKVSLHPKSVNARASFFESKFLIYHLKLKSTNINLHDTSMVHPLPLIFFGRSMNTCTEDKNTVIELSNLIRFSMKPSTADLIKELRIRLDWILEQKISNPGVTDWRPDSDEGCILRAISKLISTEDRALMEDDDDEDDSIYSE